MKDYIAQALKCFLRVHLTWNCIKSGVASANTKQARQTFFVYEQYWIVVTGPYQQKLMSI